jgi:hypothetical protein
MAGFGKRPWGSSPFGSLTSGITGIPESKEPTDTPVFGTPTGGTDTESVLSLNEFENAIFFGDPDSRINPHHVAAYVESFEPDFGLPSAIDNILKAKTWSNTDTYQAYVIPWVSDTADLGAIVRAAGRLAADLPAYIFSFGAVNTGDPVDLPAFVQPHNLDDMQAIIATIDAVNLAGDIESIASINLPGQADPVPSVDLPAFSGAHPPEDVPASIASVRPVDLPVYIIGGFSDTLDMGASLATLGQVGDLQAFLNVASTTVKDLAATVRTIGRGEVDLPAFLQPHRERNLTASIITQRIYDVRAIILGVAPASADLHASIARIDSASFDMLGYVLAQFIDLTNVSAAIRVIQLGDTDMLTSLTSVAPFFNVNKVPLQFVPLTNLDANLTPFGGHLQMRASITPVHEASTGTADDAGFIITATSYRLYLGTSRGLFVPPQNLPQVRISTYVNNSQRPDLNASISAYNQTNLSASIKAYPSFDLSAYARALDLDHVSDLVANIGVYWPKNLQAAITVVGAFTGLSGSLVSSGYINDLPAVLVPFIDPLALHIISVSTQPIADLGALINYDPFVKCSPTHLISSLSAHIRPVVTGTLNNQSNMLASLTSTLSILDMTATIIGRKRTRVRLLSLTFTAKTRASERIRGSIVPVHKVTSDVSASILGLLHEFDLPATLTPIRYTPNNSDFTATERVTNIDTWEAKDVLLSFRTQVRQYVYEEVTEAVYATDRGTWTIDLRTLLQAESFFDRAEQNREYLLDDLQEFYSLDEAIRSAIVILCERRQANISASLTVRGQIGDLAAQVTAFTLDRASDLHTTIMPVVNLPDISASINTGSQSSSLAALSATVSPRASVLDDLSGEIFGTISSDMAAEITAS